MSDRAPSGSAAHPCSPGSDDHLHLPSLSIRGLRGIRELSIPNLGRVTLLAGRNGVGKTTVLDAVRIYAARASLPTLSELLAGRDEIVMGKDADGADVPLFDSRSLFHGRDPSGHPGIRIGPLGSGRQLGIENVALSDQPDSATKVILAKSVGDRARVLKVTFGDSVAWLPPGPPGLFQEFFRLFPDMGSKLPEELACEALGPGPLDSNDVARLWDRVTLTDDEDRVIRAVNLATVDEAARIAVVGNGTADGQGPASRRVVARLQGHRHPVPLRSLGDGAVRLLGVAVALANSRDGFLLIDEAENGIHHSLQRDFWRMVLQTARDHNVQVLATTHGWDCVRGFAQAATDLDTAHGALFRLERDGHRTRAVEYREDELAVAARDGIEVR